MPLWAGTASTTRLESFLGTHSKMRLFRSHLSQTQYGITPDSISTPDQSNDFTELQQGVNMAQTKLASGLERLQAATSLLEKTVELGWSLLQEIWSGVICSYQTQNLLLLKLTRTIKSVFPTPIET